MTENYERDANADEGALRAALADALGDEFVALVDSHPALLEQHPDHLWALVELDDPVERMRHARAYVAQLEGLRYPTRGQASSIRGLLSPADAYASKNLEQPPPTSPPAEEVQSSGRSTISASERASAQLRLRVEGWLTEVEHLLRRIDANTLERLQGDDRTVVQDHIDRVRSRLLFLVSGRPYPDEL